MERLTVHYNGRFAANTGITYWDIVDRLAAYEDAENQGLLVRLPCAIGDHVFRVNVFPNGEKVLDAYPEYVVHEVRIGLNTELSVFAHRIVDGRIEATSYEVLEERDFGRILFPSLEEAKAALVKEEAEACKEIEADDTESGGGLEHGHCGYRAQKEGT